MLNINFKVDNNILAREMISKSIMPVEYANYLWDRYNSSYIKLQKQINVEDIDVKIIQDLQQQLFFKDFLKQANENLIRIKQKWIQNEEKINKFLLKIMKCDFDLNLTCYIVSPRLNSGHNIGNNSFIWGHTKGLKDINYDLVYLVHESLHAYFSKDNLSHAIIEEISDIELSKLLNKTETGYECHNFTLEDHIKIFPFWNLYLSKDIKEIEKEQKNRNIEYEIYSFEKFRSDIQKMDINQFIIFLKNKIDKINFKTLYKIKSESVS